MFQTNRLEKSLQRARFCDLLSFRKNPDLIAFTLLAAAGIFATGCSTSQKESAPIWASDETPKELLSSGAGEGPAWHPELGMLFSGDGNIQRWNPETGELSVFREGAGTNGLLFDYQGRLLACEPKQRQVTRLELDGSLTVLTSHYRGSQYNAPNDITTDANGRIYFSDPKYRRSIRPRNVGRPGHAR